MRKLNNIDFQEYINQYDIIFLSEAWTKKKGVQNFNIQNF